MIKVNHAIAYSGLSSEKDDETSWNFTPGTLWDTESKDVNSFVKKVYDRIGKSGKEHTEFKPTDEPRAFPNLLKNYLCNNSNSKESFETLASTFTDYGLKKELKASRLNEGIVIVFVNFDHYSDPIFTINENGEDVEHPDHPTVHLASKFLVLMVRNTGALKFTDDLQISNVDVIDMKQLIQGAQIDIPRFMNSYPKIDFEKEHDNYISFVKGIGDIRDYFKKSMNAEDMVTNKKSSENLSVAIEEFFSEYKLERNTKEDIKLTLYNFSKENKNQVTTIEQIEDEIDRCIPISNENARKSFIKFINDKNYEINDEFEIKENIIKTLVFIDLELGFAKLILSQSALGKVGENKKAKFNPASNELTFTATISNQEEINKILSIING
ncbi:nucleoid-associated protein [Shewanella sp. NKUCC01_JLK]|uniref:nucleoid-associated protein n=1 Tax=Shewanella sp. NKUCC01_JLK TaxID=2842123 RepID=UPI001C5BB26D|nr:nucleoid-associated protein [Shewanella sp. NKUCC01_JLK]MBW3513768.1 nucleoid-associated protein [Shewanella sp. NKUCC01_JLK]